MIENIIVMTKNDFGARSCKCLTIFNLTFNLRIKCFFYRVKYVLKIYEHEKYLKIV